MHAGQLQPEQDGVLLSSPILTQEAPPRVVSTPLADAWIATLAAQHGPLMFHQSGGCCDGSSPMCYLRGEFRTGASDVFLGTVAGDTPMWIGAEQYVLWAHTQITIDVVPGRGAGFSLEAPEGIRFLTRSRVFDDVEYAALVAAAPAITGAR